MRRALIFLGMLCTFCMRGTCQVVSSPSAQPLKNLNSFTVSGESRLNALARLGASTQSTLLIVCGEMNFLREPVTLSVSSQSVDELIVAILRGPEHYMPVHRGSLIVISPARPAAPINRILELPLGARSFPGQGLSYLSTLLDLYIREATGCHPTGYLYAGPSMKIPMPPFALKSATFLGVVEQVANAAVPSMWIVAPDAGTNGCISDPRSMWQVGLYSETSASSPFRESTGPQFVH